MGKHSNMLDEVPTKTVSKDLVAFQDIVQILRGFERKDQKRIMDMVVIFLDLTPEADDA